MKNTFLFIYQAFDLKNNDTMPVFEISDFLQCWVSYTQILQAAKKVYIFYLVGCC